MMENGNYVSQLNEHAQRERCKLDYEDQSPVGPDHNRTFIQRVVIDGTVYPSGSGKTKREAKQSAAKNALKCLLNNEHQDSVGSTEEAAKASTASALVNDINYICWLNEHGQKNRVTVRPEESTGLGPNNTTYCCRYVVGDEKYPTVTGKTKREAKEEAAKLVYDVICGTKTTETANETYNHTSTQQREELNVSDICKKTRSLNLRSDTSFMKTNYIGLVNHYCQKTNRSHSYVEERRSGPSHNPQFFYKLVIDDKNYPEGEGKTIMEARQNAARLAWSALQEQSDWDSKVSFRSTVSEDGAPDTLSGPSAALESEESSSQSLSESASLSIAFIDSPNPSNAQMALGSAMSEDDPSTRESLGPSQGMPTRTTSSGIFTDSSNSSEHQHAVDDRNMGTQSRFTSDFDQFDLLGSGGFGRVYKARHKLLKKDYAVKIVCCEEKSLREVSTLSDLQHRNIVRYYTFWMEDSGNQWTISDDSNSSSQSAHSSSAKYLYIQMELCHTRTLKEWIEDKNDKSLQDSKRREESLNIFQQIVTGVEYIHSEKHIHRDLKPANILFGLDGEVKIGDFGLVTRDDDGALIDRTVCKGTPTYMAPEQKREKNYDRKVDIFPLGLIYLELLWKVSSGHERGQLLGNARCQNLPSQFSLTFPREEQIIKLMLCEKPEGRPEASEVKAELEKCAQMFSTKRMSQRNETVCRVGGQSSPEPDLYIPRLSVPACALTGSLGMEKKNYVDEPKRHERRALSELKYEDVDPEGPEHNQRIYKRTVLCDRPVFPVAAEDNKKQTKLNAALSCPSEKENRPPEGIMFAEGVDTGNSSSETTSAQSKSSRFTSDFDRIICLGEGAFGRVFEAEKKLTKHRFAVKIVLCKENKKALREVKALTDLHHRNIVRYYTCWLEDSGYQWDGAEDSCSTSQSSTENSSVRYLYIQMELCDTKTLKLWIDEKNTQNEKESLRNSKRREESRTIATQIVSGVEYIHFKKLIHRDLKPANIMFGRDGEVKIGDFGLVTDENDDDAENLVERTVNKGTPCYMAPEQSQKSYNRKIDIFALGLICFELFWSISTTHERQEILDDVRRQKFPKGFSGNFSEEYIIIKPMLCAKPDDRPEASKVKTDLEACSRRNSTRENTSRARTV
ncbi:uncharacterized protein LOC143328300 [Chaetodon auriga]|uniref:uncharacterized protein LOC143328300 n=1 Tax=Chaetodon auriga TaxID=39042 RepID=UPI0040328A38